MYRSQVLKWQHGDLKIPLWFYLAQALYFNGDQKPLFSLYCLGLSYYIWVTSGRNANTSESQWLILQNEQISLLSQTKT